MLGSIEDPTFKISALSLNARTLAWLVKIAFHIVEPTLRKNFQDRVGARHHDGPTIVVFWHNRLLGALLAVRWFQRHRQGLVGLTSYSGEGTLLTRILEMFGVRTVRGSSSRRGAEATRGLLGEMDRGYDVALTPDGPKGPPYVLGRGAVFLSQQTGAPIAFIDVEFSRCLRLKTWDRFMIPLPFSRVEVTIRHLVSAPRNVTSGQAGQFRKEIEQMIQPQTR